jgi:hypothetical protein
VGDLVNDDPRFEALISLSADASAVAHELDHASVIIRTNQKHALLGIATANLLVRLIPSVEVLCEGVDGEVSLPVFGTGAVAEIAHRVVERARLVAPKRTQQTLTISTSGEDNGADLHVSASAWSVTIGRTPLPLPSTRGPAITAASALIAAEAVRHLVSRLPGRRIGSGQFVWNLLDYRCTVAPHEPHATSVDAVCFGGGSVGSSAVYALLLGGSRGSIVVVDPDRLTHRNRVRYPMLLGDCHEAKTSWLEAVCRGTDLSLTGRSMTVAQFVSEYDERIPVAVAAVDSASARRDVADALARETLNAGVAGQQFHVSRHGFNDGFACVYCGYLDVGSPLDETNVYVQMTGLRPDQVRSLLDGATLSLSHIEALIARGLVSAHERGEFEGARLQDVVRRRAYAQAELSIDGEVISIAAPYVSALAGAVLAAELQKAKSPQWWLNRRVDIDCSGYPTGLQSRPTQDRTGRCLCRDTFRQNAYRDMWCV